eukprot:6158937-Pyramimonas_sp.AAC.1
MSSNSSASNKFMDEGRSKRSCRFACPLFVWPRFLESVTSWKWRTVACQNSIPARIADPWGGRPSRARFAQ